MRLERSIFLLVLLLCSLNSLASDSTSVKAMMFGVEMRADPNCILEFHFRKLNRHASFAFKTAYFQYTEIEGNMQVRGGPSGISNNYYNGIGIPYNDIVKGVSIKPGYIFAHRLKKHWFFSHTIYGVFTLNTHCFTINYPDNKLSEVKWDQTFGAEYEFLSGVKISKRVLISLATQIGVKQRRKYLFDKIVTYPSYYHYAPAQGFGDGKMYINATLGCSYIF